MSVPTRNTFSFTIEYQYRLGDGGIWRSPAEKDLEVFADDFDLSSYERSQLHLPYTTTKPSFAVQPNSTLT